VTPGPSAAPAAEGIVTPEGVVLEFPAAGLGSRSLAFLVDGAIRLILISLLSVATAAGGIALDATAAVVIAIAGTFAALFVYPAAFEALWDGRTPGKAVLGLRVVTVEGAPVRFRHAAIRSALGIVDFLLGAGALAVLCALATRQSQRLGDLAAGTIVVRERQVRRDTRPVAFAPPPGWERYAASLDVTRLRPDAAVLVRAFLLRVHELEPAARRERAADLAGRVAGALGVPFPAGTDPELFLIAVSAAHQARHGGPARPAGAPATTVPPPAKGVIPPPVVEPDEPAPTWGR
jgi:uncharacterized RDD family membrane protein YckC